MRIIKTLLFALLTLASFSGSAQSVHTIGEIYNYDIGDEFHHQSDPPVWQIFMILKRVKIMDKFYSADGDTVFYVRHNFGYSHYLMPVGNGYTDHYGFSNNNDTIFYTHLNDVVDMNCPYVFDGSSETTIDPANQAQWYYVVNQDIFSADWGVEAYEYSATNDPTFMIGDYLGQSWGVGIGIISAGYTPEDNSPSNYGYELTYYKKGDISFGVNDTLEAIDVGLTETYSTDNLIVYPNPAFGIITINAPSHNGILRIMSIDGKCVYQERFFTNTIQFDSEVLSKGSYFVTATDDNGKFYTTRIIKRDIQ
jgi:hypothetical protein